MFIGGGGGGVVGPKVFIKGDFLIHQIFLKKKKTKNNLFLNY
jgi:hypothetical protein